MTEGEYEVFIPALFQKRLDNLDHSSLNLAQESTAYFAKNLIMTKLVLDPIPINKASKACIR